jgi:hypothetical protein
MSAHITEELPRLLTGEADRDAVLAAAEHLRGCADCQQELVSAVVAHASLMSARRFASEVVQRPEAPPRATTPPPAHPLPDPSELFAKVSAEADHRSRRPSGRVLAAVAAAVVVIGGGTAAGVIASSSGGPATRSIALVGADRPVATATLIGSDHMRIDATSLPRLDESHQYEVWLTTATGGGPLAVGWIGRDKHADIRVPAPLMGAYQDIAVSVQGLHQTRFSGDVVARGNYA